MNFAGPAFWYPEKRRNHSAGVWVLGWSRQEQQVPAQERLLWVSPAQVP